MQNVLLDSNSFSKVSQYFFWDWFFIRIPHPLKTRSQYNFNNNKSPEFWEIIIWVTYHSIFFSVSFTQSIKIPTTELWQRYKDDVTCSIENVILQIRLSQFRQLILFKKWITKSHWKASSPVTMKNYRERCWRWLLLMVWLLQMKSEA